MTPTERGLAALPMTQKARISNVIRDMEGLDGRTKFRVAASFATALGLEHGTSARIKFLERAMGARPNTRHWLQVMTDAHGHGGI